MLDNTLLTAGTTPSRSRSSAARLSGATLLSRSTPMRMRSAKTAAPSKIPALCSIVRTSPWRPASSASWDRRAASTAPSAPVCTAFSYK
eukprot:scaffold317_cov260-Pinguiococcus_pyrenoidosus.AAC.28